MFIEKLKERDLLNQITSVPEKINGIYCGFDITASSFHVGSLTFLSLLRVANLYNIPTIALVGEATSAIGDPSDKKNTRKKVSNEDIQKNIPLLKAQIKHLCPHVQFVNNYDWIKNLNVVDFLELSAYLPVSYIIKFKTFADRLSNNDPFNMQELLYPLIQGYDFLHLFKENNCNVQVGGQDQWCNILTGTELIKRKYNKESYGITLPLLTNAAGEKMGKSVQGAVFLNLPVYEFWQFWRNVEDKMVITYIKRLTLIDLNSLPEDINERKILLANEITSWVYNKEEAMNAYQTAKLVYSNNNKESLPVITLKTNKIIEIICLVDLSLSKTQVKKLIQQKAIKINDILIEDIYHEEANSSFILSIGKKNFYNISVSLN